MKYIKRDLERKFLHMDSFFKAVLVTGARQVGKTTMLKHLAGKDREYVTLDNIRARELAQTDPVMFFQRYKPPIIIDEIQYAPELFSQIKIICDETDETGLFWLSGSQQYSMMKHVQETLAGRVGILELYSMSKREKDQVEYKEELDFSFDALLERQNLAPQTNVKDIFQSIWVGGMPQVLNADNEQRNEYYNSYVNTYLMRDVVELGGVTDSLKFIKFLSACAALTSQQLNMKKLSEVAEIAQSTAAQWLKLLEGLGIIYLLNPYANNHLKRLARTPKLYFCDTGLCAHLSMWLSSDTLLAGASAGSYFENHVVVELMKNYAYTVHKANLMYYRDSNNKEIDVLVEVGENIHPLEIKLSGTPNRREVRKFDVLNKAGVNRGSGGIICMSPEVMPIDEQDAFIPCGLL